MKNLKKCPLFIILVSSAVLLTILGIGGMNNVYATQDYNPWKAPVLSVVFTGINEDIYPWQIFSGESREAMAPAQEEPEQPETSEEDGAELAKETPTPLATATPRATATPTPRASTSPRVSPTPGGNATPGVSAAPGASATPGTSGTPGAENTFSEGRLEPLRESTHEEYMNHISADIYGDAGVLRAASYAFATVDESYFDDALFIGDSRMVGLYDYTDLGQHADFYCETSLTIYKVMEENFPGKGTVADALASKDYGKIYIMVGINELGRGTTEDFMEHYTEVIDTLRSLEPEALIFIQGIMRVSEKKNAQDAIFNNSNINARNNAIATLADNQQIFYIDGNEVVCDENGNLTAEYTFDNIHLLGVYNDLYKQFLLSHGVEKQTNS